MATTEAGVHRRHVLAGVAGCAGGEGSRTVDIGDQMGVDTEEVQDIVVTAQKRTSDDRTLRVAIRKDGDTVAEGSTDTPEGQVMVSHRE